MKPELLSLPGQQGFGLLHAGQAQIGVLILVGGPQYRVGAHRHFVQLARALSAAGYPALRFDHRGVGDRPGPLPDFTALDDDIAGALDAFFMAQPQLRGVVLWGLCDAASAALLYLRRRADRRVLGLCLLNPWVRSPQGEARARVQHYYRERLRDPAFWRKLLGGGVGLGALRSWWAARRLSRQAVAATPQAPFQVLMAEGWRDFPGAVLLQLSGRDHTAREFEAAPQTFPAWTGWQSRPGLTCSLHTEADHTFSNCALQDAGTRELLTWLGTCFADAQPSGADGIT